VVFLAMGDSRPDSEGDLALWNPRSGEGTPPDRLNSVATSSCNIDLATSRRTPRLGDQVADWDNLQDQLASLYSISVEIAGLHELAAIQDRALGYCLELTASEFAFTGLLRGTGPESVDSTQFEVSDPVMDVAAIKGFEPSPDFYETFHLMAVRPSVVGVVIRENRSHLANDLEADPHSVGQPAGHPPIRRFLGVPLSLRDTVIGMIGVANKSDGYDSADERLLSTFAGQVAVAVDNARLYEQQRQMIAELQELHERLTEAERMELLARDRQRIAGALHDQIEQEIFTIGVRLNSILDEDSLDQGLAEQLRQLRQLSIQVSDEVRRAIFALTDPEAVAIDLIDHIRSLLAELQRESGIHAHLSVSGSPSNEVGGLHDVARAVIEEALANAKPRSTA
jgi:signal transduction histidine kinase